MTNLPIIEWSENDDHNRKTMFDMIHSRSGGERSEGFFRVNHWAEGLLRGLNDGEGRFLWQTAMATGENHRFAGYPVITVVRNRDEVVPRIAFDTTWRPGVGVTPEKEAP